jgi:hypothetical protein
MENTKHTPGPWKYHMGLYDGMPPHARGYIYPVDHKIEGFNMYTDISGDKYEDRDEVEANARLIAAAPELLEALELVRVGLDMGNADYNPAVKERVAAAIAKATGQQ